MRIDDQIIKYQKYYYTFMLKENRLMVGSTFLFSKCHLGLIKSK